jgi:Zn-dependent peptidase ImmA (M78 family)
VEKVAIENRKPSIGTARKVARKLLADVNITNPPIVLNKVVAHIKKSHNFTIRGWDLGKGVDGLQITSGDRVAVAYNQDQHRHRQRFTVAHEIGHFMLGHTSKNHDRSDDNIPEEIEANQFAAELLMPLSMLKHEIKGGNKICGHLAKRFDVSEEALWIRIKECGLLKMF